MSDPNIATPVPGDWVRIKLPNGDRLEGEVISCYRGFNYETREPEFGIELRDVNRGYVYAKEWLRGKHAAWCDGGELVYVRRGKGENA